MARSKVKGRAALTAVLLLVVAVCFGVEAPAARAADAPVLAFPMGVSGASGSPGAQVSIATECYGICLGTLGISHDSGGSRLDVSGQLFALGGQCSEADRVVLAGVFLYFGGVEVGTSVPNPVTGESVPYNLQIPLPGVTMAMLTLHAGGAFDVELTDVVTRSLDPVPGPSAPVHMVGGGGSFSIACY